MGSSARVYPFDYNLYVRRVVPAIQKFMLSGSVEDWLSPIVSAWLGEQTQADFMDYLQNILPPLRQFLQTGDTTAKLSDAIAEAQQRVIPKNGTDLARYCTHLDVDFSWKASNDSVVPIMAGGLSVEYMP